MKLFQIIAKDQKLPMSTANMNVTEGDNETISKKLISDLKAKASAVREQKHIVLTNLSKCIGGVCVTISADECNQALSEFTSELQSTNDLQKLLALYCIGDIGQTISLPQFAHANSEVLTCFEAHTEEIKMAASLCLGHLCVGNRDGYLPLILIEPAAAISQSSSAAGAGGSNITSHHQYLLLCSLKEIITVHIARSVGLNTYLNVMLRFLLKAEFIESEDEAFRSIVADSLGGLLYLHCFQVLPSLQRVLDASLTQFNPRALWTIISTFKSIFSRTYQQPATDVVSQVALVLPSLVPLLTTADDLEVRKTALLCVHSVLHHHFNIIQPLIAQIEPLLIESVLFKLERVVDLGPFKHKVDDGIPIRKSALLCKFSILF